MYEGIRELRCTRVLESSVVRGYASFSTRDRSPAVEFPLKRYALRKRDDAMLAKVILG